VGFAVPINLARWVANQLKDNGQVERSYLGVGIQPVNQSLAEQFHMKRPDGVLVTEVRPDSPAAKAGMHSGDVILKFAGKAVSKTWRLQGLVEEVKPGTRESVEILRDGKPMTLTVTLEKQPARYGMAENQESELESGEEAGSNNLGLTVESLTPELAKRLGVRAEHGVAITEVASGSAADLAGLRPGMVITQVDRKPVKSLDDFRNTVQKSKLSEGVLLLVHTDHGAEFVVLKERG